MHIVLRGGSAAMFVVIDMWSYGGTRIRGTSVQSVPGKYRLLFLPADRPTSLLLGCVDPQTGKSSDEAVEFGVNLKECCLCMNAPRTQTLACGHTVACAACSARLRECPLCRAAVCRDHMREASFEQQTYQHGVEEADVSPPMPIPTVHSARFSPPPPPSSSST